MVTMMMKVSLVNELLEGFQLTPLLELCFLIFVLSRCFV